MSVAATINEVTGDYVSTRLVSFPKDGGKAKLLVKPKGKRFRADADHSSQFQDRIVSLLPNDKKRFLISLDAEDPTYPGVYLARVDDERKEIVQPSIRPIRSWYADQQGRVRVGRGYKDTKVQIFVRSVDEDNFKTAWEYEYFEDAVYPLGFGLDPNILYVEALHNDRKAVFKVDLRDSSLKPELIYADPEHDVDAYLIHSPRTHDVVGIKYFTDRWNYVYLDKIYEMFQKGIDKVLPNTSNHFVSFSADETRYIAYASSGMNPGTYYYGDIKKKQFAPVTEQYPGLNETNLSGKKQIEYESRDGLRIEGYLTIPKESNEDHLLPAVILPDGGPAGRETGGFDLWSEFLASRGYAVLQMNFRGSSGYGQRFSNEALRSWGMEMQDDIIDGTRWLIEQKIVDPERICIFGGSYGGYAALLGGIQHPEIFQCAVSFAGVTDLRTLVFEAGGFINSRIVKKQIGNYHSDAKRLDATSPLQLVENLKIPVLIAHGTRDTTVPFKHAEIMVDALEKHDKIHWFLKLENGDHHLSLESNRTTFFKNVERFLEANIGGENKPAPARVADLPEKEEGSILPKTEIDGKPVKIEEEGEGEEGSGKEEKGP
ncbi:MAG: S9 family peptidase [bacterium]|nr:S9 family peptidase [bacterium]